MRGFIGELVGTFILVTLGCGSVAWTILVSPLSLLQIALIWGIAVFLGIIGSAKYSQSHLNPAVSIGFVISGNLPIKQLPWYILGQLIGAYLAALGLYYVFSEKLIDKSVNTAMMFGEYYPNPGNPGLRSLSTGSAFFLELFGTFLLMFGIYIILKLNLKNSKILNPLLIGVVLSCLIYFIAPFTQAGFNPARDFAPRLFSFINGWSMAFSYNNLGWMTVYILGPIVGCALAGLLNNLVLNKNKKSQSN